MISMLESKPSLGDLTSKSGQGYREHYFYAYSQPLREYLDDHPDFTFVGLNVHHSIEKDKDWTRYLGYSKLQSKNNLRGIPLDINPTLHNSKIAVCWNQLYALYPDRSNIPEDILLERAKYIDDQYGHLFVPAIRPVPVQGADFMPDCEPPAQP